MQRDALPARHPRSDRVDHIGVTVPNLDEAHDVLRRRPGLRVHVHARALRPRRPLDERAPQRRGRHRDAAPALLPARRPGDLRGLRVRGRPTSNAPRPATATSAATTSRSTSTDLDAAVAHLHRLGLTVLGEPTASNGPSEGQRWVYFLSPWGMQFELVSYPDGKAFDKQRPLTPPPVTRGVIEACPMPTAYATPHGRQPAHRRPRARADPVRRAQARHPDPAGRAGRGARGQPAPGPRSAAHPAVGRPGDAAVQPGRLGHPSSTSATATAATRSASGSSRCCCARACRGFTADDLAELDDLQEQHRSDHRRRAVPRPRPQLHWATYRHSDAQRARDHHRPPLGHHAALPPGVQSPHRQPARLDHQLRTSTPHRGNPGAGRRHGPAGAGDAHQAHAKRAQEPPGSLSDLRWHLPVRRGPRGCRQPPTGLATGRVAQPIGCDGSTQGTRSGSTAASISRLTTTGS